jgi:hypothetical protein
MINLEYLKMKKLEKKNLILQILTETEDNVSICLDYQK